LSKSVITFRDSEGHLSYFKSL